MLQAGSLWCSPRWWRGLAPVPDLEFWTAKEGPWGSVGPAVSAVMVMTETPRFSAMVVGVWEAFSEMDGVSSSFTVIWAVAGVPRV